MIYVTGDTHSDFRRFQKSIFPQQSEMTKDDYCIIAGDFGGIWYGVNDTAHRKAEDHNLDELNKRSFTTLFVPGNHENYTRLMSGEFLVKEWKGGLVKEIRPSILMLMRGEMYEIDGIKIFAFGGARSHDISDGILDGSDPDWTRKAKLLKRRHKYRFRVKGISWWEEELPSEEEMQHGLEVLSRNGWKSDLVITHCAPSSTQAILGAHDCDIMTCYLEEIKRKLDYKRWLFGHYHGNRQVSDKETLLYGQIIRVR